MIFIDFLLNFYRTLEKEGGVNTRSLGLIYVYQKRKVVLILDLFFMCLNPYFQSYGGILEYKKIMWTNFMRTSTVKGIDHK